MTKGLIYWGFPYHEPHIFAEFDTRIAGSFRMPVARPEFTAMTAGAVADQIKQCDLALAPIRQRMEKMQNEFWALVLRKLGRRLDPRKSKGWRRHVRRVKALKRKEKSNT